MHHFIRLFDDRWVSGPSAWYRRACRKFCRRRFRSGGLVKAILGPAKDGCFILDAERLLGKRLRYPW